MLKIHSPPLFPYQDLPSVVVYQDLPSVVSYQDLPSVVVYQDLPSIVTSSYYILLLHFPTNPALINLVPKPDSSWPRAKTP